MRQVSRTVTRVLGESDIPQMVQMEKEVFGPEAWSSALLTQELQSRWGDYLGVFGPGDPPTLIAYGGIKGAEEGDLMTLAVAQGWRRRGVGRLLTSALLARAQERGMTKVFLEVRRSNLGAQKLYEGLGFSRLGVVRDYYRSPIEDAVTMVWEPEAAKS